MFEREYRDLAHVPRWGIIPVIHRQSVAEHSYYVSLYASHIVQILGIGYPYIAPVLYHCLEHDRSECYTSDIPGPVKRGIVDKTAELVYETREDFERFGANKFAADEVVLAIRKLADLMDEYAYWKEEGMLGNQRAGQMLAIVDSRLLKAAEHCGKVTGNEEHMLPRIIEPFKSGCNKKKVVPHDVAA